MRIGINAYYGRVRYVLRRRADGEGRRRGKEATVINNIKIIIAIVIHTPPLIALYYI